MEPLIPELPETAVADPPGAEPAVEQAGRVPRRIWVLLRYCDHWLIPLTAAAVLGPGWPLVWHYRLGGSGVSEVEAWYLTPFALFNLIFVFISRFGRRLRLFDASSDFAAVGSVAQWWSPEPPSLHCPRPAQIDTKGLGRLGSNESSSSVESPIETGLQAARKVSLNTQDVGEFFRVGSFRRARRPSLEAAVARIERTEGRCEEVQGAAVSERMFRPSMGEWLLSVGVTVWWLGLPMIPGLFRLANNQQFMGDSLADRCVVGWNILASLLLGSVFIPGAVVLWYTVDHRRRIDQLQHKSGKK